MSKVAQFITHYPSVDGYTLICVCEEINRRWGAGEGVDGILQQALLSVHTANYLIALCEKFQA